MKTTVSFRVPHDDKKIIERHCKRTGLTKSELLRSLTETFIIPHIQEIDIPVRMTKEIKSKPVF